jgi:hypothetical protein
MSNAAHRTNGIVGRREMELARLRPVPRPRRGKGEVSAPKIGDWVWHFHHEILMEPLMEPFETRQEFIRSNKLPSEIETRLRLFQPVRGKLTLPKYWQEVEAKWEEAYAKWREADAKWREAYAKWREADAKRQEAYAKRQEAYAKWQEAYAKRQEAYAKWQASPSWKEVEALHRKECPNCPWNGSTIFP